MNKSRATILISLIAITIILIWWFSPSQIIKRQTHTFVQCIDIPETATKTYRALKTNSFSNLLANAVACKVDISNYQSEFSRDQLIESHQLYAFNVSSAMASANNVEVSIIDDQNALSRAGIHFAIKSKKLAASGEKVELELKWKRNDAGKWQITNIEMLGALDDGLSASPDIMNN